jgi:hypothetical protein
VALLDAVKAIAMFRKVNIPVLGMVENMSFLSCPHCNERIDVFSHGGGRFHRSRCFRRLGADRMRRHGSEGDARCCKLLPLARQSPARYVKQMFLICSRWALI